MRLCNYARSHGPERKEEYFRGREEADRDVINTKLTENGWYGPSVFLWDGACLKDHFHEPRFLLSVLKRMIRRIDLKFN